MLGKRQGVMNTQRGTLCSFCQFSRVSPARNLFHEAFHSYWQFGYWWLYWWWWYFQYDPVNMFIVRSPNYKSFCTRTHACTHTHTHTHTKKKEKRKEEDVEKEEGEERKKDWGGGGKGVGGRGLEEETEEEMSWCRVLCSDCCFCNFQDLPPHVSKSKNAKFHKLFKNVPVEEYPIDCELFVCVVVENT